jgi:hypothetical protein
MERIWPIAADFHLEMPDGFTSNKRNLKPDPQKSAQSA